MWPWRKKQKEKFDPNIQYDLNFFTSDGVHYYVRIDDTISARDFFYIICVFTFIYEYDVDNASLIAFIKLKKIERFFLTEKQILNEKNSSRSP